LVQLGLERGRLAVQFDKVLETLSKCLGSGFIEFDLRPGVGTEQLAHERLDQTLNAAPPAGAANLDLLAKVGRLPAQEVIEAAQLQKSDVRRLETPHGGVASHPFARGQAEVLGESIGLP
jgi:hypothetical protein